MVCGYAFLGSLGSMFLGLGIGGLEVGVPEANAAYDQAYRDWLVQEQKSKACCGPSAPTNQAPCVRGASITSIAVGGYMMFFALLFFILLLTAFMRARCRSTL